MKKLLASVAIGAMMLMSAGQAMAAFEDYSLVRTVYKKAGASLGAEIGYDLGNVKTAVTQVGQVIGTDAINLNDFGTGTTWNDLYVAYFAVQTSGDGSPSSPVSEVWLSDVINNPEVAPSAGNPLDWYSAITVNGQIRDNYNAKATGNKATIQTSDYSSYWFLGNGNGTQLSFWGGILPNNYAEANLGALATGGTVDLLLYAWEGWTEAEDTNFLGKGPGEQVAQLRVELSGGNAVTRVVDTAPVPVPASVLLLGSGLLGLIGIRRKNNA